MTNTYLVKLTKTEYFYVPVKAKDAEAAEIKALKMEVIDIEDHYDDCEWEAIALEQPKTPLKGTI